MTYFGMIYSWFVWLNRANISLKNGLKITTRLVTRQNDLPYFNLNIYIYIYIY